MSNAAADFVKTSDTKAFDSDHRRIINYNIGKYDTAVERGLSKFANLENSKRKAHTIKWKVMENLDKLLPEFETNFQRKGGKVIWANDAAEANKEILQIIKKAGAKTVIKSKSMATEEIELNEFLEENHIETVESDLGEYIVQLLGQKPYHIVTPAMHLSKEDIAKLFNERFGTPIDATPEQLTLKARELLREKYTSADVGITGGNFLIADTGSIALTENEGNARLTTTFPKIHIAVVGIEKLIPSINDLDLFWPILSTHGTGQNLTVYNTILEIDDDIFLSPINHFKFGGGWFNLISSKLLKFIDLPDSLGSYGVDDTYVMICCNLMKQKNYNIQQYVLKGNTVAENYKYRWNPYQNFLYSINIQNEFRSQAEGKLSIEVKNFINKI
jgi:L-lactate dehydrogenase complex protein LldF